MSEFIDKMPKYVSSLKIILNRKLRRRIVIAILEENNNFVKESISLYYQFKLGGLNASLEFLASQINWFAMKNGIWRISDFNFFILPYFIEKDLRKLIRFSPKTMIERNKDEREN